MASVRFSVNVPDTLEYTSVDSIEDNVSVVRGFSTTGKPRDMFWRKFQLNRLYSMIKDHEEKFYEALAKDLGKSRHEALMGDVSPLLEECLYFMDNIDRLSKDETVTAHSLNNRTDTCIIRKDPLGVVLIIGCWNYPLQLGLVPLAGAIAAGNAAVIKLSEISLHTAALITELFPKYMDISCYRIVNGGAQETTELLQHRFDHIFYTGGGPVAKIVMTAAAKHLTPVTLELGGKSPAIVTADANIKTVASRIVFGKFFNTGQSCVAVDYVLVPRSQMGALVDALKESIEDRYGKNPKATKDYGRIVSVRHFDRLIGLLERRNSGSIVMGGDSDRESRYIAPTVIADVSFRDAGMMQEGDLWPYLPIVPYNALEDAISMVRRHEPPLALYIFANKKKDQDKLIGAIPSGGVCINDTLVHFSETSLPFGGVGASGMGKYHGEYSFKTFTHERSILVKKQRFELLMRSRYPPYTSGTFKVLRMVLLSSNLKVKYILYKREVKHAFIVLMVFLLYYVKRSL